MTWAHILTSNDCTPHLTCTQLSCQRAFGKRMLNLFTCGLAAKVGALGFGLRILVEAP